MLAAGQIHDPVGSLEGRGEVVKMATSQGNVSPPFFLVMVGITTWRLKIRLEPGFLLKTKGGRDQGEIDWSDRSAGKWVETGGDKRKEERQMGEEKRESCSRRKQPNNPGDRDLGGKEEIKQRDVAVGMKKD